MSEEILDDLEEIDDRYQRKRSFPFAIKAMNYVRLSAMLYALIIIMPMMMGQNILKMSTMSFIVYFIVFATISLLGMLGVTNAVKSIIHKERAYLKRTIALIIGAFLTYLGIIAIWDYYVIFMTI